MKMKACIAAVLLACLIGSLAGCKQTANVEPTSDPNVVNVQTGDPKMDAAIKKARGSLPQFLKELESPSSPQDYFALKVRMVSAGGQAEHIWVENLKKLSDSRYSGTLGNDPYHLEGLKYGSTVEFDLADVSDWMIRRPGGKLEGGYTIEVLGG